MSKKNKDIQVQINEEERLINGEKQTVTQLVIGKKNIGEIIPENKNFQAYNDGHLLGNYKTLDDGIEALIRNWNLHE
ncbi:MULTISPECIES: DUF2969 domain-containing protein [Enterococcus]|uniref:DUF2969 domain-containing protein n=1 Tax=Enterococcus malodoratus ATCC 43197 TaxID=1158601 RepID=R2R6H1_9ENTE|nr:MULTISPECIES: DUF2969 domain-containing protein [Enterococcus]BBM19224.1 hypothetical protein G15_2898 [Enterococcus avium]EOH71569.1 hypothetical protein UAI_04523 [Enterococcus malodoratus ATCC 43197]EOT69741.1 hypothetical protein I585_01210 [Enterococcus malodoratus ATCC 43197]OJG63886.1 hypothetical protein RV07_GL000769 [Enterococcus malodoratus]SES86554.1 Protein of unknown function [Enterococcus malodoratus]